MAWAPSTKDLPSFLSSFLDNSKILLNPVFSFYFGSGGTGATLTLGGDLVNPDLTYTSYEVEPLNNVSDFICYLLLIPNDIMLM